LELLDEVLAGFGGCVFARRLPAGLELAEGVDQLISLLCRLPMAVHAVPPVCTASTDLQVGFLHLVFLYGWDEQGRGSPAH